MDRRFFLKVMGWSSFFSHWLARDLFAADTRPVVAVAEGKDHVGITSKAIRSLGGMKRFVKPGDVVVVKPNIGWDRTPEQGANTSPAVVWAVVQEAYLAGAKKVKVFDRSNNDPRRCYANSGIAAALQGLKHVELKHMEEERFKKVPINGAVLKEWEIYGEVLSADVIINVAVAKHHHLTKLTLGLKNIMGIMGGDRGRIHKYIDLALADVNAAVKTHLTIIDATRILTAHGPQGGDPADVKTLNTVIASTDMVAADAYATTLFGLKPGDIGTTVAAHKRGLGEMNLDKVRILKV